MSIDTMFLRSAERLHIPRHPKWGGPMILPPGNPTGKPVYYSRISSYAKLLDDASNLNLWYGRMTALGLSRRPDLAMLAGTAQPDDKTMLNDIVKQAMDAAQSSAAANRGTALHAATEHVDLGGEIDALPADMHDDIRAYQQAMKGLRVLAIEKFVVLDDFKVGGTFDRLLLCPDGKIRVGDVKGLALDTKLPTPNGWTTMGDVAVGDQLLDSNGNPCTVTTKSEVKRIGTHIVTFNDGSTVICDTEHLWWVVSGRDTDAAPQVREIGEIAHTLRINGQSHHRVPVTGALTLPDADLPIEPYLLGCWLGDGANRGGTITKESALFDLLESDGQALGVEQVDKRVPHVVTRTVLGLTPRLREVGLLHNKHIPDIYMRGSIPQRFALLRGLMDTDGTWNKARNRCTFNSTNKRLAHDVHELLLTLGYLPHSSEVQTQGFGLTVTSYAVEFAATAGNPFRLRRKADRVITTPMMDRINSRRVIVDVRPGPDVPTACVSVDSPNSTYLCTEALIPTHNTGSSAAAFPHSASVQMSMYAHGLLYTPDGTRSPMPGVDLDHAVLIHLPQGTGTCELHLLDIAAGWEAAQLGIKVKDWRKSKIAQPYTP